MITNIKLDIDNNLKTFPLKLNQYGILEIESQFDDININQIIMNFSTENQHLKGLKEGDQVTKVNAMPKYAEMLKIIYAAHLGYCKEYSQKPITYEEFLDGIGMNGHGDLFQVFFRLIASSENDKKKHLNQSSKKQHHGANQNTKHRR